MGSFGSGGRSGGGGGALTNSTLISASLCSGEQYLHDNYVH